MRLVERLEAMVEGGGAPRARAAAPRPAQPRLRAAAPALVPITSRASRRTASADEHHLPFPAVGTYGKP